MVKKRVIFLLAPLLGALWGEPEHMNLSAPYEWLFDLQVRSELFPRYNHEGFSCSLRGEWSYRARGFLGDITNVVGYGGNIWKREGNALWYLGELQNAFAPFLGDTSVSFSQQCSPLGGNTTNALSVICGEVTAQSYVVALEKWFNQSLRIGWYLPYYVMRVSSISTTTMHYYDNYFESYLTPDLLASYSEVGVPLLPATFHGIGDSELLLSWQRSFFEERDFIRGILCALRCGAYLPTAGFPEGNTTEKTQETLLKIPLGFDASWGILFGGNIEVTIADIVDIGVVADCMSLFGSLHERYIYRDVEQTGLLLLTKVPCFIDPGFKEQFAVYLSGHNVWRDFLITVAYQYNKQHRSAITVTDSTIASLIAGTSPFLQPWTTHHLVVQGIKKMAYDAIEGGVSLFVKMGFNGMRSIVLSTVGVVFEVDF